MTSKNIDEKAAVVLDTKLMEWNGMEIIHYNSLEFFNELDHMSAEDEEKAKELLKELTSQANSISIPVEEMLNDVRFYVIVNKILDRFECNAFTLPCFELCATKQSKNCRNLLYA